jgi:hypothetical protein
MKGGASLAHFSSMRLDFAVSLSVILAVLFIGTVGAFLLYVPALTIFSVTTMVTGLGLMFALGLLTGTRWRRLSPFSHRSMPIKRDLFIIR